MTETITIEKEVWESTLRTSMERAAEIEKLKEQIDGCEQDIEEISLENEKLREMLSDAGSCITGDLKKEIDEVLNDKKA